MDALKKQEGGSHYKEMTIQLIEFITANNIPFMEGNCIKYLCRHRSKNGAEDIKKVIHYCELMLQLYYGSKSQKEPVKEPLCVYSGAVIGQLVIGWWIGEHSKAAIGIFKEVDNQGNCIVIDKDDYLHICNRTILYESEEQFERLKKYGIK